jgi:hypothetical protein
MLQDFIDAGHLEKENRGELEFILTSQFVHHQSHHQSIIHSSNALSNGRRKSIMPDFLHTNSRRPSHHSSNSNNALNQNKSQVSINMHDNDVSCFLYSLDFISLRINRFLNFNF